MTPWMVQPILQKMKKMKPYFEYEKLSEISRIAIIPVMAPNWPAVRNLDARVIEEDGADAE